MITIIEHWYTFYCDVMIFYFTNQKLLEITHLQVILMSCCNGTGLVSHSVCATVVRNPNFAL